MTRKIRKTKKDEDYLRYLDRFCLSPHTGCEGVLYVVDAAVTDRKLHYHNEMFYTLKPVRNHESSSIFSSILPDGFIDYFRTQLGGEINVYYVTARFSNGAYRAAYLTVAVSEPMPYSKTERRIAYAIAHRLADKLIRRFPELKDSVKVITEKRKKNLVRLIVRHVKYIEKRGELQTFCDASARDELELAVMSRTPLLNITDNTVLIYFDETSISTKEFTYDFDKTIRKIVSKHGARVRRSVSAIKYMIRIGDIVIGETNAYEIKYTISVDTQSKTNLATVLCEIANEMKDKTFKWDYEIKRGRRRLHIHVIDAAQLRQDIELVL
ncbi:MAG: hypothetical protein QXS16_02625 [Pyrobaculum sp.]